MCRPCRAPFLYTPPQGCAARRAAQPWAFMPCPCRGARRRGAACFGRMLPYMRGARRRGVPDFEGVAFQDAGAFALFKGDFAGDFAPLAIADRL